jgi:hypothetical protein
VRERVGAFARRAVLLADGGRLVARAGAAGASTARLAQAKRRQLVIFMLIPVS